MNISILLNKYKNPHWLFKMIEMLMKNPSLSISIIKISQNDTYNNNLKFIIKKYVELDRKLFKRVIEDGHYQKDSSGNWIRDMVWSSQSEYQCKKQDKLF